MDSTDVELGERLKLERQRLGFNQADFGALLGVSKTSQFNYEAGDRSPHAGYLRLALEQGVDVNFLLTGHRLSSNDDFVVIPQHAVAASAGPGSYNGSEWAVGGLSFSRRWLTKRHLTPGSLRVIDIAGESMAPRRNDGDNVLMDISDTSPRSGRAYVLLQGDELLVKYCMLLPDNLLRVSSENTNYPTYDIDLSRTDGVTIVGRVRASTHEW
jgi:phage repressor protein C with HTH and peptisase S24 domain